MKIKVPSTTIEACDICKRPLGGGSLTECAVCGREYCHTCEAIIMGCIDQPDLCMECGKRPEVEAVVKRFAKPLIRILNKRENALSEIPTKGAGE